MNLAESVLAALIAHENDKPRNQQVRLGPSEIGGCREYVRNVMIGTPMQDNGEVWPTAAVVGTLIGDHMEKVLAERMGALTEVSVTTTLPNGVKVSGHADIVLVDKNAVVDCKSKDRFATIRSEGPSLDNLVQVSTYTLGLVQAGVLKVGATAHLMYVDRSGQEQTLEEVVLEWDTILSFVEKCVERLDDVLEAQEHIDKGEVEWARDLRDKTPPFCYSERVLCPFRDRCWAGSEWKPNEKIEDPEIIETVQKFVIARADQDAATQRRSELRERLIDVSGLTPDGYSVAWRGNALYVTKVA